MTKRDTIPMDTNQQAPSIAVKATAERGERPVGRLEFEDDDTTSQMLRVWANDWDSDEDQSNRVR